MRLRLGVVRVPELLAVLLNVTLAQTLQPFVGDIRRLKGALDSLAEIYQDWIALVVDDDVVAVQVAVDPSTGGNLSDGVHNLIF